jgi:hypothetical protein
MDEMPFCPNCTWKGVPSQEELVIVTVKDVVGEELVPASALTVSAVGVSEAVGIGGVSVLLPLPLALPSPLPPPQPLSRPIATAQLAAVRSACGRLVNTFLSPLGRDQLAARFL